jgi:hypothetical protein
MLEKLAAVIWLFAVPGGALLLGIVMLMGWLQWRKRNRQLGYTAEGGKPGRPEMTVETRHQR